MIYLTDGTYLSNLKYADEIIMFASSLEELQQMIKKLAEESEKSGLKINLSKTKVMIKKFVSKKNDIIILSSVFEKVEEYLYLGQLVNAEGDVEKEIIRRIRL